MLPSSEPDRIQIAFDDHRLVSNAGLILPATLAQRLGLGELANNHVDLGDARVRAMLCGARSLYAISQWGRDQGREVSEAVGFTRERTPGVSTLHQVFIRLDREAFELALGRWLQQQRLQEGEALAIDGKRLRGLHGEQLPGVHLVAAYAHRSGIVVGQQTVGHKRNELEALSRLLMHLDLSGRVITGDAKFTQRKECRQIVAQGGTTSWR